MSEGRAVMAERWRTGCKVGRTIYAHEDGAEEGRLIGMMDTPELAAEVVRAVNDMRVIAEARARFLGGDAEEASSLPQRFDPDDQVTWPANDQRVEVFTAGAWRDASFRISPAGPYWSVPGEPGIVGIFNAEAGDRWIHVRGRR